MVEKDLVIDVKQNPAKSEIETIEKNLYDFNDTLFGRPCNYGIFIRDINSKIQGGVIFQLRLKLKLLYIDYIWVAPELRNKGFGTKIVKTAEQIAKDAECNFSELETLDFQAEAFYQKLGYKKFGIVEKYMGHFNYIFMRKQLDK